MYKIMNKGQHNKNIFWMDIHAPLVAKNAKPGQFLIVRTHELSERIPLTIVWTKKDIVHIIVQTLGFSTTKLSTFRIGEEILDVVGPLGQASHIRTDKSRVLGIAGGVGAAPLYPQLKEYHKRGITVDVLLGAKSKEYLLLEKQYSTFCNTIYITTDDGSKGTKGFVTDALHDIYQKHSYDHTIAIGPLIMMKHVVAHNKTCDISTDVSLNPIMIDGTGMCGNCRVSINNETFFACIDGPDFPGEAIDFDELIARQSYYKDEEHTCNIRLVK